MSRMPIGENGTKVFRILMLSYSGMLPLQARTANFDTAWTLVYDGEKSKSGNVSQDRFMDLKILPNGDAVAVGSTEDSLSNSGVLIAKISPRGELLAKRLYVFPGEARGSSVTVSKQGDFIVGGDRFRAPLLLRLAPSLDLKSSAFYYDSLRNRDFLSKGATLNSISENKDGEFIAVAGDVFPDNDKLTLSNYAAYLAFDPSGAFLRKFEWMDVTGYNLGGWSLAPVEGRGYLIGGNQAAFYVDSNGVLKARNEYTFSLPGVGTVENNVMRVRTLRNGTVMILGQSYEEDCWTKYQRLYYEAWWSPLSGTGRDDFRFTAGVSGSNDILYDVTQLLSGDLAFVGKKNAGGMWAFVTDSTGKDVLWEKQVPIPYKTAPAGAATPYAVAAAPDSGFTVAGPMNLSDSLGGSNGFMAHFVPKTVTAVRPGPPRDVSRRPWTISFRAKHAGAVEFALFDLQGKQTALYRQWMASGGAGEFHLDQKSLRAGLNLWRLNIDGEEVRGVLPTAGLVR